MAPLLTDSSDERMPRYMPEGPSVTAHTIPDHHVDNGHEVVRLAAVGPPGSGTGATAVRRSDAI